MQELCCDACSQGAHLKIERIKIRLRVMVGGPAVTAKASVNPVGKFASGWTTMLPQIWQSRLERRLVISSQWIWAAPKNGTRPCVRWLPSVKVSLQKGAQLWDVQHGLASSWENEGRFRPERGGGAGFRWALWHLLQSTPWGLGSLDSDNLWEQFPQTLVFLNHYIVFLFILH